MEDAFGDAVKLVLRVANKLPSDSVASVSIVALGGILFASR